LSSAINHPYTSCQMVSSRREYAGWLFVFDIPGHNLLSVY
jgi:hypothetical protein